MLLVRELEEGDNMERARSAGAIISLPNIEIGFPREVVQDFMQPIGKI